MFNEKKVLNVVTAAAKKSAVKAGNCGININ